MLRLARARICVVSLLLTVAGGAIATGQANAYRAMRAVCGSSTRHEVVARNAQAEVYREHKAESEFYQYRGCVYGSRRSFQLGKEAVACDPYACFAVSHLTLAGYFVAYEVLSSVSPGGVTSPFSQGERSEWHVVVVNLRTGRVLHKVPTGKASPPAPGVIGAGETSAIVVKADGAVAWITNDFAKSTFEVHAVDKTGERVLAVGSNIAPTSLALAGNTLYWTEGGKPFSAMLN